MATIGRLTIDLEANVARLESDLKRAGGHVHSTQRLIQDSVNKMNSFFGVLGITLGAGAFVHFVKGSIDAADKLKDLSQKTGTAVADLAGLKFAADQNGTSLEAVAMAGKKLAVNLTDTPELFRKFGITARDSTGAMVQLADVFASMPDGVNKTALAVKLMGKSGEEMIPFMNQGSEALRGLIEQGKLYNPVTAESAMRADEFNDSLAELKASAQGNAMTFANALLPTLTNISEQFSHTSNNATAFAAAGQGVAEVLKVLVVLGANTNYTFTQIGNGIGGMAAQLAALAHGDFTAFSDIQKMLVADGEAARAEIDKFSESVLNGSAKIAAVAAAPKASGKGRALLDGLGGGSRNNSAKDAAALVKDQINQEKELRDAALEAQKIIYDIEPLQKAGAYWEHLVELKERGLLTEEQTVTAYAKTYQAAEESAKISTDAWKTFADNTQRTMSDVLYKGFNGTFAGIGDMFKQMLLRMAADAAAMNITSSLIPWLSGLRIGGGGTAAPPSGGGGSMVAANGAWFDGNTAAFANSFANGGAFTNRLYDRATPFLFANGGRFKAGVMGEAGPEAVMPLTRGRDGKLGVQASGGGLTLHQTNNINIDSRTDQAEVQRLVSSAVRYGNAELVDKLQRAGAL